MTLIVNDGSCRPSDKPDDIFSTLTKNLTTLLSPNLIRHLPASIEKLLSNNSFDEKIFQESAIYYEDTLNKAGYIDKVAYNAPSASNQENRNKNRQRNVIWFNLPCSKSAIFLAPNRYPFSKKTHP